MTTLISALNEAKSRLRSVTDSATLDARLLLEHATGLSHAEIVREHTAELNSEAIQQFDKLVGKRKEGVPIAYLTGRREFWSQSLMVTPATLIPRPETERLVEVALALIPANTSWDIADLGTGCGSIALAIACERPSCQITATDISVDAIEVAQENCQRLKIDNVGFRQGSWFSGLNESFYDLIVSNPPYVRNNDPHLMQGDVRFEPREALSSGVDGLDDLREIIGSARNHLKPGGWLLVEHGFDQARPVTELMCRAGFNACETFEDLSGNDRVTRGQKKD